MNRLAALSLWAIATSACAVPPLFIELFGGIRPDFNAGNAFVAGNLPGQSFFTLAPSDQGWHTFGDRRIFATVSGNPGMQFATAGDLGDFNGLSFHLTPQDLQSVRLAGMATYGRHWSALANLQRPNGEFDAKLYVGYKPASSTGAFEIGASLTLNEPESPAEGLDWDFLEALFDEDDPLLDQLERYEALLARKVPQSSCYAIRVIQLRVIDLGTQLSIDRENAFDLPSSFPQCHGRTGRVRSERYVLGPRTIAALRGTDGNAEQLYLYMVRRSPVAAAVAGAPPTLSLDTSFGGDGQVIIRAADPAIPVRYWDHAIDTQGRVLVVYGLGRPDGSFQPTLLRLKRDGTLDTTFTNGGVVVIATTGQSTNPRTVTVDINGHIQVSGETYTATTVRPFVYFHVKTSAEGAPETYQPKLVEHAFPGRENSAFFRHTREPDGTLTAVGASYGAYPDTSTMRPLVVQLYGPTAAMRAIEFFHAAFGHFVTVANPAEVAKLDSGETAGWARTKKFFYVYPLGTPGTTTVDRHFSTGFAKSSHVFAASAAESAAIKQNPDWLFEGPVFGTILPNASGKCPGSLHAVTRIYNNGVTGAPNHQFGDDPTVVDQALARGGTREGLGPLGAIYCSE